MLRATGERVAVKVQRPGIGASIAIDMLLLRRLMGAIDAGLPQVSQPLVPLVDEFAARLFGELDYVAEGRSCEKFQVRRGEVHAGKFTPRSAYVFALRVFSVCFVCGLRSNVCVCRWCAAF